jgi:hypothetical protein
VEVELGGGGLTLNVPYLTANAHIPEFVGSIPTYSTTFSKKMLFSFLSVIKSVEQNSVQYSHELPIQPHMQKTVSLGFCLELFRFTVILKLTSEKELFRYRKQ